MPAPAMRKIDCAYRRQEFEAMEQWDDNLSESASPGPPRDSHQHPLDSPNEPKA